jgi:hypothetical protein
MKVRKVKQVLSMGRYQWEGERAQGKGKGGWIWSKYVVFMYENRKVKPVEIVLKGGEE